MRVFLQDFFAHSLRADEHGLRDHRDDVDDSLVVLSEKAVILVYRLEHANWVGEKKKKKKFNRTGGSVKNEIR